MTDAAGLRLMTFAGPALRASETGWRWHAARGAAVAAIVWAVWVSDPWRAFDAPGAVVLWSASVMALAVAVLVGVAGGVSVVEDCRDEGRLPLLRMAEARGWRLALNLCAGVVLQSVTLAGLVLPAALLAVTIGGVTPADVLANAAVCAAAAVAAVGGGMLFAAVFRRPAVWISLAAASVVLPELMATMRLCPGWMVWVKPMEGTRALLAGGPRWTAAGWLVCGGLAAVAAAGWRLLGTPLEGVAKKSGRRRRPRLSGDPHVWRVEEFDRGGRKGRTLFRLAAIGCGVAAVFFRDDQGPMIFLMFALMGVVAVRATQVAARRVRPEADGGEVLRLVPGGTGRSSAVSLAAGRGMWFVAAAAAVLLASAGFAHRQRFGLTVSGILLSGWPTAVFAGRLAGLVAARRSAATASAVASVAAVLCVAVGFGLATVCYEGIRGVFGSPLASFVTGLVVATPAVAGLAAARRFEPEELHLRHAVRGVRRRDGSAL